MFCTFKKSGKHLSMHKMHPYLVTQNRVPLPKFGFLTRGVYHVPLPDFSLFVTMALYVTLTISIDLGYFNSVRLLYYRLFFPYTRTLLTTWASVSMDFPLQKQRLPRYYFLIIIFISKYYLL